MKMKTLKLFQQGRLRFFGLVALFGVLVLAVIASCSDDDESTANELPNAIYSTSLTDANIGQEIAFTDQSTDPDGEIVSWSWNFADGTTSALQNPSKSFDSVGTFNVTLEVTDNSGGKDTFSQEVNISQGVIIVEFATSVASNEVSNSDFPLARTFSDSIYFANMPIQFTDVSGVGNAATANFSWDFGDGTTSIEQNPTHTYTQGAASYNVTLTITDDTNAIGTFTKTIHVPGIKWSVEGQDYETMSPAIDSAGDVYVGTRSGLIQKFDGQTGAIEWTLDIGQGESVRNSIVLSNDESKLYVGSNASVFHAINASDGESLWSYETAGRIDKGGAALDNDGNIYLGDRSGILYAFSQTGDLLWQFEGHPEGSINSNTLYHNGSVISISNNVVYSVNATDGTQEWSYIWNGDEIDRSRFEGGYAIDQLGVLYGAYQDFGEGGLFALDLANGNVKWSVSLPADARANSPLLSPDESVVYISTEDGVDQLSVSYGAFNTSDGSAIWITRPTESTDPTGDFKTSGALGETGTIYVSAFSDYYYLIDSQTGKKMVEIQLTDPEIDLPSAVPGIGDDGTIYWGSRAQKFFALYFFGELESLPSTGWPVRGADNKNRNRLR